MQRKLDAEAGRNPEPEGWGDWTLNQPEAAWRLWTALESIGWKHLPEPGGLLDQDEGLLEDLATLSTEAALIYHQMRPKKP